MEQREYIVEAEGAGQRIDRFLSGEDTGLSRSALQALVADGHVLCNGRLVAKSLKLKAGDTIWFKFEKNATHLFDKVSGKNLI